MSLLTEQKLSGEIQLSSLSLGLLYDNCPTDEEVDFIMTEYCNFYNKQFSHYFLISCLFEKYVFISRRLSLEILFCLRHDENHNNYRQYKLLLLNLLYLKMKVLEFTVSQIEEVIEFVMNNSSKRVNRSEMINYTALDEYFELYRYTDKSIFPNEYRWRKKPDEDINKLLCILLKEH